MERLPICCLKRQKVPSSMVKQPPMSMTLKVRKAISICVMCSPGLSRVCLLPTYRAMMRQLMISVAVIIVHDWHGTPSTPYSIRINALPKFQIMTYPKTRCDAYLSMKFSRNKTLCKAKRQFNTPWTWHTILKKKDLTTPIPMGVLSMTPLKIGPESHVP